MRTAGTIVSTVSTRLRLPRHGGLLALAVLLVLSDSSLAPAANEKLELTVVDSETGQAVPCRVHLRDNRGRPRRLGKFPSLGDHFATTGQVTFQLPVGSYQFEIERGPEYVLRTGHFTLQRFSDDTKTVDLKRIVDLKQEGWWSGDLHLQRPVEELPALMEAEDLHIAANVTWTNKQSLWNRRALPDSPVLRLENDRYCELLAGRDERAPGTLLFFHVEQPAIVKAGPASATLRRRTSGQQQPDTSGDAGDTAGDDAADEILPAMPSVDAARPTLAELAAAVRRQGGWVDVENPFSPDLPVLLAQGTMDSFQLAHGDLQRNKTEMGDVTRFLRGKEERPGPLAPGEWAQRIYYQMLEAGFRIPPSAGSGSGVSENPVGYNRMYVHLDGPLSWEAWWEGFRAGRVMVTNGPLLRPVVQGAYPGHVFTADEGQPLQLQAALNLTTREPIHYLEIVQNGRVAHVVRLTDLVRDNGRLPPITFEESGWFLIRAVAENQSTYRFGSTAPYYVEIGGKPRISRKAAQFFLDWVDGRLAALEKAAGQGEDAAAIRLELQSARRFWQGRVRDATAE